MWCINFLICKNYQSIKGNIKGIVNLPQALFGIPVFSLLKKKIEIVPMVNGQRYLLLINIFYYNIQYITIINRVVGEIKKV